MKFTILVIAAVLAGSLSLAGCAGPGRPVRIGVNDWPPCAVWSVATKEGFLKGLPIELVHYSSWSDNMSSLYLGKTDFTHSTYFNSIYFAGKGEGAKIVLSLDTIEGSDGLVISNRFKSPKDLAGARIAVEVFTDEHFLLYKALESFGIPSGSVKIVSTTSKEAADRFLAGDVDACFTYDPYLSAAASSGKGKVAWTTKDAPGYMIDTLVASDAAVTARRADTAKLLKAWFKALDFIRERPDQAYPVMAESLNMNLYDFKLFFEAFKFYSPEENRAIFGSAGFKAKLGEMGDFLLREKAIASASRIEDIYTAKFVADGGK